MLYLQRFPWSREDSTTELCSAAATFAITQLMRGYDIDNSVLF